MAPDAAGQTRGRSAGEQREGVRVSVVSTLRPLPPMVADEFVEPANLAPELARETRQPETRVPTPARPESYC